MEVVSLIEVLFQNIRLMSENNRINKWNWDNTYLKVDENLFRILNPFPVNEPRLVLYNQELANELDLNGLTQDQIILELSGNQVPEHTTPLAQAYAGHQFGHFNILGDGRAILLGEHVTKDNNRFDIQLKGSGRTYFSRNGDGRATLYAMLREYLISEAMHGLKIPTTRSLAVIATGDEVYREKVSEGGVLTRIAKSHIRVGTFQYAAKYLKKEDLKSYVEYVINRHYPELLNEDNLALALLKKVQDQQIDLIVNWMRVGFIHGVMNTDNVSIAGETIDYGPCAFMNAYHPETVFSSIDRDGRYAYGNQPVITQWNMARFASALLPIIHEVEEEALKLCETIIYQFPEEYEAKWLKMMSDKLGILEHQIEDKSLVDELLSWMQKYKADYTNTFLNISKSLDELVGIYQNGEFQAWKLKWNQRIANFEIEKVLILMNSNNPSFIPRNHLVEEALLNGAEKNDFKLFNELLLILKNPYQSNSAFKHFQEVPADFDLGYQTFCGT